MRIMAGILSWHPDAARMVAHLGTGLGGSRGWWTDLAAPRAGRHAGRRACRRRTGRLDGALVADGHPAAAGHRAAAARVAAAHHPDRRRPNRAPLRRPNRLSVSRGVFPRLGNRALAAAPAVGARGPRRRRYGPAAARARPDALDGLRRLAVRYYG